MTSSSRRRPGSLLVSALRSAAALAIVGTLVVAGTPVAAAAATPGAAVETPCALPDITPVPVPTPSPLPTHDETLPTLGGDAIAGNGLSVPAGSPPLPADLAATSWLVADLDTGEVLGACGAHRYAAPASLQKLLLVATVLPKLDPADVTTITPEDLDFEPGSSAVGLLLGGQYSVETLFLGLMLNSGNDAANTLARLGSDGRGVAGTLADMNAEARRLGAWDTHAETPSGLDGPGQVSSAYDLALIFRACFAHEDFRRYVGTRTAQMPPQPSRDMDGYQIQNDNRLLYEYPGALGGKTGFTDIARHTFVGAAERDGRRLVASVLGAEIRPVRAWQQAAGLLDWGFGVDSGASVGHLVAPGEAETLIDAAAAASAPVPLAVSSAVAPVPVARSQQALLLAVGAGVAAFTAIWLVAGRLRRRRQNPHRQWGAEPPEPAVAGAAVATASPSAAIPSAAAPTAAAATSATATMDHAAIDHAAIDHAAIDHAATTEIPVVPSTVAQPPTDPGPPPLMGQPPA